jgi:hypothetical protein
LDDDENTRKSLARLSWLKPTLEEQFQLFRIQKEMSNTSNELKYLDLLSSSHRLREMDFNLCFHIYDFVQELSSSSLQPQKCDRLAGKIAKESKTIQAEGYSALVQFPGSSELLYQYGTFMYELMRDPAGFMYIEKARSIHESLLKGRTPDGLNALETQPAFCVSCHPSSLGEIHYINDKGMELFGVTKQDARNLHVNIIMPRNLAALYERLVEEVLVTGMSIGNIVRYYTFVINETELNPLMKVQAKVLFREEIPYFFVSFQADSDRKGIILFNSSLIIQCHSADVKSFIGLATPSSNFKDCYLPDLFPDLPLDLLSYDSGAQIPIASQNSVMLLFEHVKLGKETYFALSILPKELGKLMQERAAAPFTSVMFNRNRNVSFHETSEMLSGQFHESVDVDRTAISHPENTTEQHVKAGVISSNGPLLISTSISSSHKSQIVDIGVKAEQGCRRLKLLLLASIVILVAAATATALFLMQKTEAMKGVGEMELMSQRRSAQIYMANAVRRLQLQAIGLEPASSASIRISLLETCGNYSNAITQIKSDIGNWPNGATRDMYFHPSTMTMQKRGSEVVPVYLDLFAAMYALVSRCYTVANAKTDSSSVEDDKYFILRNAPAEMLKAVNESMFLMIGDNLDMREDAFKVAEQLFIGMGAVACFCYFCLLLPQVLLLERTNRAIWSQLYSVSFDKLVEVKHRLFTRLQSFHNLEISDFEMGFSRPDELKGRKILWIWPGSMLKLASMGVLTALVLLSVGFGVFGDMVAVLRTVPNYMNWVELRTMNFAAINYWLKETELQSVSGLNYKETFNKNAYWPSPDRQFLQSLAFSKATKSILTNVSPDYGILTPPTSSDYINFRTFDACANNNPVPDCANKVFKYGFVAAAAEMLQNSKDLYVKIMQKRSNLTNFASLDEMKDDILATSETAIRVYKAENDTNILELRTAVLTALLTFAAALLLVYVLWLSWEINRLRDTLCNRTSVLKLLNEG